MLITLSNLPKSASVSKISNCYLKISKLKYKLSIKLNSEIYLSVVSVVGGADKKHSHNNLYK